MIYDPHPDKRCSACTRFKPFKDFSNSKKTTDGLMSHCKKCHAENERQRRKTPEHKIKERDRSRLRNKLPQKIEYLAGWRKRNPDKIKEYAATDRIRHREHRRQKRLERYVNKRDHELAVNRAWAKAHPHVMRAGTSRWRERHPEYARVQNVRHQARKHSLPVNFTIKDWRRAKAYFAINDVECCAVCGRPAGLWHTLAADHWIPLTDPRPDNPGTVPTNMVPLCHAKKDGEACCNNEKYNHDALEWLTEKYGKRKAAQVMKRVTEYFEWVKSQD